MACPLTHRAAPNTAAAIGLAATLVGASFSGCASSSKGDPHAGLGEKVGPDSRQTFDFYEPDTGKSVQKVQYRYDPATNTYAQVSADKTAENASSSNTIAISRDLFPSWMTNDSMPILLGYHVKAMALPVGSEVKTELGVLQSNDPKILEGKFADEIARGREIRIVSTRDACVVGEQLLEKNGIRKTVSHPYPDGFVVVSIPPTPRR
jgi:hypothetical protein